MVRKATPATLDAPKATRRAKTKERTKGMENFIRSFEAAQFNRLNSTWASIDWSPSQELFNELKQLKVRARDLYSNSPVISNFVSLLQQNVVGHKGFTFRAKVPNSKGGLNTKINRVLEAGWADFCKAGNFEVTGQWSLNDALDQMVQSLAVDGEILGRKIFGMGKYGIYYQMLHSEQLITTQHEQYIMGILRDAYGRPQSYAITDRHPSEGFIHYIYEPAERMVHAYLPYQIGAPRGIPMFVSSMMTIRQLEEYRKAEIIAARIEASKFVKYTQQQPDDLDQELFLETALPASQKKNTIQPGMAEVLPPGVDAEYVKAEHPNTAFPAFDKALKKEIAAGLGISYNTLYSDFEATSFSSMRAAFIVERAFYRKIQNLLIEKVLRPLYEAWVDMACASGSLDLPPVMGSYDFYKPCEFIGKSYEFSNPLQEAEAQAIMIANRLMSRTQICAENGTEYAKVLDDFAAEKEMEEAKGLAPVEAQVTPAKAVKAEEDSDKTNEEAEPELEERPTPKPKGRKSRITKSEDK